MDKRTNQLLQMPYTPVTVVTFPSNLKPHMHVPSPAACRATQYWYGTIE